MRIQHQLLLCYSLFLFFFVTTTLICPSLGGLGRCNPSDYKALMNIKNSLNSYDLSHVLTSWVQNTDCCNWRALSCDEKTNRVVELYFGGEISGKIPSSVGDLPYLESLSFRDVKNITGSVPQSVTKLKYLNLLDLTYLNLSGPIPNFLNQLSALDHLDLSHNQFSGSIPPNLSDLKNIGTILLNDNQLTGSIPESFGKFSGLRYLYLSGNKLTGPIPKSLGALELSYIDLSSNKLVGDASMLFNPNHSLTRLIALSRNQFEFDLTNVKFPKYLDSLDISHNKIFGGIPEEIKDLNDLETLEVGYKCLCGSPLTGCKKE